MKLIVDLPPELINTIRELAGDGEYTDVQSFLTTALENQVQLEQEGVDDEAIPLVEALAGFEETANTGSKSSENEQSAQDREVSASVSRGETQLLLDADNSTPLNLMWHGMENITVVEPPNRARLDIGPLWGQYNRLFPVKLVVRGLATELQSGGARKKETEADPRDHRWRPFPQFSNDMACTARQFGQTLARLDKEQSRRRGEKFATGLPTGDDAEKSMKRFQTHFLGYLEQSGDLSGCAPCLRLVDIQQNPHRIGLTEAGLEFAELQNPLIDTDDATQAMSEGEQTWYLNYVKSEVPDEYDAMQLAVDSIAEGDNRPNSLTESVATLDESWTEAQASTVRSGLVGRMTELGLITSTRVGRRGVEYRLTDAVDQL